MSTTQLNTQKQNQSFYLTRGHSTGSDFIYDQTYKNIKTKQRFQKDPKYSYFNAIMQMKQKLSSKQQLYNNIFTPKNTNNNHKQSQQQNHYGECYEHQLNNSMFVHHNNHNININNNDPTTKTTTSFYHHNNNKNHRQLSLFYQPLDNQIVRIQQLKRNSFKIVKDQQQQQISPDVGVSLKKQNSSDLVNNKNNKTKTFVTPILRSGHKSNMSLYEKSATNNMMMISNNNISFSMTPKQRNKTRNFVEVEIIKHQSNYLNTTHNNNTDNLNINIKQHSNTFYQPSNPKPRLDEIMSQYKKINKNSHNNSNSSNFRSRKSSLPKEFVQRLYQTNKIFYRQQQQQQKQQVINKKRGSLVVG